MHIFINHLIKDYNNQKVLHIEKLEIKRGELYGIIGPNGAGKSTLLKIMAGLEPPTSGVIKYDDREIKGDLYKKITLVFQKPYMLKTNVFQNIAYPLIIRKEDKKDINNKVNQLVGELEIKDIIHQRAETLSGGEAQKVALARALIIEPLLLLLDEPTANIDPSSIETIERVIKKKNKRYGITTVIITHNIQQARRLCDKVAMLNKGYVIGEGEIEKIIFNSQNPIINNFVKASERK